MVSITFLAGQMFDGDILTYPPPATVKLDFAAYPRAQIDGFHQHYRGGVFLIIAGQASVMQ